MNHNSLDLSYLSDSSRSTQTITAGDFDASENCSLSLESDKKTAPDGILHRISHFTKRSGSRCRREFCNDDDNDDGDNRNNQFYAPSRQLHRKTTIKRYVFLFGFVSTLIIFSQLCLSQYNSEPAVEGLFAMKTFQLFLCLSIFSPFDQSINLTNTLAHTHTHIK